MRPWHAVGMLLLASGCRPSLPPQLRAPASLAGERSSYVSPLAYEHYLRAQLAAADGRSEEALDQLRRALAFDDSAYLRTRLAEELLALGRIDEARDQAEMALRLDPGLAEAYIDLGRIHLRLGEEAAAEAAFRRALEIDRRCEAAYLSLAALYRRRGDAVRSEGLQRDLLARLPTSGAAHFHLAQAAASRGEAALVEAELRRALALEPALIEARLALGELLHADGRTAAAVTELGDAFARSGRSPELAVRLALALRSDGRSEEAEGLIERLATTRGPAEGRLAAARALCELGLPGRALPSLQELLKERPTPSLRLLLGRALVALGRGAEAKPLFAAVPVGAPEWASAQLEGARLLADGGRLDEALATLGRALHNGADLPADADLLTVALADLHERAGNRLQARRLLEGALAARPTAEPLVLAEARLLGRLGEWPQAVALIEAFLRRAPESADGLLLLAEAHLATSRHIAQAERLLQRVLTLRPGLAGPADRLGVLLLRLGRLDEAKRYLERAVRLSPEQPEILAHLGELALRREDRAAAMVLFRRALAQQPSETLRQVVEEQLLLLEEGRAASR